MGSVAVAARRLRVFDPHTFLTTIGTGRRTVSVQKGHVIYAQGAEADAIFHVLTGKVRLTVTSPTGKEATIGIVGPQSFVGEGALAGQLRRVGAAVAMTDCELLCVDKNAMLETVHREPALADLLRAYVLVRNIRYEEDLIDQLFNSSEKRLARVLLLLAHSGQEAGATTALPKISQQTLAEMVGTTRSRVSFFMNKFRKSGFIQYSGGPHGGLQVHRSLLNVVLDD